MSSQYFHTSFDTPDLIHFDVLYRVQGCELPLLGIPDLLSKFMASFDCKNNDGIWSVLIPYINSRNLSHHSIDVMRIFEYNSLYSPKNL